MRARLLVSLLEIGLGVLALIYWGFVVCCVFGFGTPLDFFAVVAAMVVAHGLYILLRRA
jgi:uncharacterized protein YhhL (DUF1145 family)